ncbi:MAG: hypothetical protein EBU46_00640 [Nitrosomonadaceae bacterium]|nr:hypothetical protein [Nitrosomonadaceae bacterium]
MSHAVKINTEYKHIGSLKRAFESLGWTIKENSKIRTYPYDEARHTVFDFVAVNPQAQGYDIGFSKELNAKGFHDLVCDFYGGSIAKELGGQDMTKLKMAYSEKVLEDALLYGRMSEYGVVEQFTDMQRTLNPDGTIEIEFLQ